MYHKTIKKYLPVISVILLFSSLLLNFYLLLLKPKNFRDTMVIEVLDGDTLLLEQDVRFRLRHLDAPETVNCGGNEAKALLISLVKNKRVEIREQILDQWGRPMGLVYIDGVLINQKMLESGWVRYHHDTTTVSSKLSEIGLKLKNDKIGIFSENCRQTVNKKEPECQIKGNIDPRGNIKRYYYPGCVQYQFTIVEKDRGEQWFCSIKEAEKEGYKKAETCK